MTTQQANENSESGSSAAKGEEVNRQAGADTPSQEAGPALQDDILQAQISKMQLDQLALMSSIFSGTQQIVSHAQTALINLPQDFHNGLDQVKNMFWIQFALGIVLLLASVPLNMLGYDITTAIFGATGGLTLITTFITSSPLRLQKNRVALAQWVTAHFNWINTLMVTSGAVQSMYDSKILTWEIFRDAHALLLNLTTTTMHNVHDMCEFDEPAVKRKRTGPKSPKTDTASLHQQPDSGLQAQ
jgi:hypothetical protein